MHPHNPTDLPKENTSTSKMNDLIDKLNLNISQLHLFEKVVVNITDAVLITEAEPFDLPGPKILYVNDAFCKMTGYTKEEVIGKTPRILQGPKTDRKQLDKIRYALQNWESVKVELINYAKDGREFCVEFEIVPVADDKGWFTHWVSVQRDVTEINDKENQLQESELLYRQIFNFSPVAIWEKDDALLYLEIDKLRLEGVKNFREYFDNNPAEIIRLLGFVKLDNVNDESINLFEANNKEEILTGFHRLFTEESFPVLKEGIIGVAEGKKRLSMNAAMQSFKGKRLDILFSSDFRLGNALNKSLVTLTDITKQLEAGKLIEESNAFNKAVLESSPDCLKVIDIEGNIQFMNTNGMCAMEIDDFETIKNKPWINLWGEENFRLADESINKSMKGETATFQAFCATVKKNPKWWDVKVSPVIEPGTKKITSLISVSRDITSSKMAEKALKDSEDRLHLATETSKVGIWEWNLISNKVHWDAQMFSIYGITPTIDGNVDYSTWISTVAPEDAALQEEILQNTVNKIGSSNRSFTIIKANDGMKRFIEAVETVRCNEEGVAEWVVGTNIDITERKKTEQQLKKLATHLELSTSSAEVGTWMLHIKSGKVEWSNLHKRMWGYDEDRIDFNFEDWHSLIISDDKERCFAEVEIAKTTKRKYEVDYRIHLPKNDSLRWIKSVGQYYYNEDGEAQTLTGISIDITYNKLAEEKLKASEENFRQLSDLMPEKVCRCDSQGNVIYYNNSWLQYTGYSYEELKDWGWSKVVHVDDLDELTRLWTHSLNTSEDFEAEFRLKNNSGKCRWHLSRAIAIKDKDGNIKNWVAITFDIEQQKSFANELELQVKNRTSELALLNTTLSQKNESLTISETFNRSLTDVSPNVIYIYDMEIGKPLFVNRAGLNVIGYGLEKLKDIEKLQGLIIHPDDYAGVLEIGEKIKKAANGEVFEHEYRVKNAEGTWTPFLARDTIFKRNNNNTVKEIIGIGVDITALKKAEKKLMQKNDELEKMNKELQSFAYISSHDLQEPLRKIQIFGARIVENEEQNLSDNGKDMFQRIQQAANRMQALIHDLLAYSRTNTTDYTLEYVDINKMVEEVLNDFEEVIVEKNAVIEKNDLCNAHVIPFQFSQLIHNLIGNALKFSKPNLQPLIKITSGKTTYSKLDSNLIMQENEYVYFSISDNGIGFDEQYKEQIFEVFQRLHDRQKIDGTGIGLAIVKKIVENHKGIIITESKPNEGATFKVLIPVKQKNENMI